MKRRHIIFIMTGILLLVGIVYLSSKDFTSSQPTFSSAILKVGSTGADVKELQGRLKFLGYYNGDVDGVFGSRTKNSVTWFQWKFGITSDGVVGENTKKALVKATQKWDGKVASNQSNQASSGQSGGARAAASSNNAMGLTSNDIALMANAVYGEARGESFEGQVAVAAVILNRIKDPNFPDTIHGVIFQPRAFTAVDDGQIYLTPNETAKRAVQEAINGWDPTYGCIYYFNPDTATSAWIWTREQIITIGRHIFCK